MGSNSDKEKNILFARKSLTKLFPSIVFGTPIISEPLFIANESLFLNQVASFETEWPLEQVRKELKHLEKLSGRTIENTANGIITLDIDILKYNDIVLKPDDLKRQYIIDSMKTL